MIYKYLTRQFLSSFLSIFLTLFLISSIIILFQIAKFTSYIELSFFELFKLYSLMSVKLIIFTTPISFIISLFMCVLRLSKENEMIMLFSLGFSPRKIANFFMLIAGFFSAILLAISIIFIPISFSLYDNLIDYKKAFSKLNLKSSNFGQKVGDWIYFSDSNSKSNYENIVLYQAETDNFSKKIILAKNGEIKSDDGVITLNLNGANIYNFDKEFQKSSVDSMSFSTILHSKISNLEGIKDYWKDYKNSSKSKELVIYCLLSLMPLAGTYFAFAFSVVSNRHEKSYEYIAMFGFFIAYFTPMMLLLNYHFYAIFSCFFAVLLISRIFFRIKIVKRF